jgi:hypothetical protein
MTNHPYSVPLSDKSIHVIAINWAEAYQFAGSWTYVLSSDVIERRSWGWVWMFSDPKDAMLFKLKFG